MQKLLGHLEGAVDACENQVWKQLFDPKRSVVLDLLNPGGCTTFQKPRKSSFIDLSHKKKTKKCGKNSPKSNMFFVKTPRPTLKNLDLGKKKKIKVLQLS